MPSVITYLREQAVNNKKSMFLFIFPRLEYRIKSTALNYFQCFKPRTFREFLDCQPFATILHALALGGGERETLGTRLGGWAQP